MFTVTLADARTFDADPAASLLDAARAQGVTLEYSCRTGRCGVCKAPLVSGETTVLRPEAESLTVEEAAAGLVLTCCRAAASDVVLDIEPLDRVAGLEVKTMPSRIVALDPVAPDIMRVVLKTPPTSPLRFLPGQYVDVLAQGTRRSYSLARAPRADGLLELLIKRYPGGVLSEYFFARAKPHDLLRIEGPFGTFFLRDDAPGTLLFLATGTGIAPVRAILEELAAEAVRAAGRRIRVLWGNRHAREFCWTPDAGDLAVEFTRVLSGADPAWDGPRGHVQQVALAQGVDPADTVVYACGSPAMIASARAAMLALGVPARRFLSDAFVSSN